MRKIGLTGGIGSGKSTVAGMLVAQGVARVDADAISRHATQSGGVAMPAIRLAFGDAVVASDGGLNRDAMRQVMLGDTSAKARLEGILHPLIGLQIDQLLAQTEQAGAEMVVLDIPLLVEGASRWRQRLDAVWVVDCLPQTQISRVQARSSWPLVQIEAVMAAQASRAQRLAAADAVIYNEGLSLQALERIVQALLKTAKA
ncbi:dephospho-CoA kinase [Variovorax sp. PCZ-1]|uniref:dephospho-CoA kinase n=1 Tax=Variovorax sp. PCZ-1 TaxID=2835533 RepID=UPI001BCEC4B2|nr:dephospho-CoA kinase [Variovorax sp. PCZ-1]MBS7806884.1 dephospho-CoA kinase [Variovorax sp. PCZ-1]